MATIKVHPIQQNYTVSGVKHPRVVCGLCGTAAIPRHTDTPARVTHLVHLVREHLTEVNATFTPKGRSEEVSVSVES